MQGGITQDCESPDNHSSNNNDVSHHGDQHRAQMRPQPEKHKAADGQTDSTAAPGPWIYIRYIEKTDNITYMPQQKGHQSKQKHSLLGQGQKNITAQAKNQPNQKNVKICGDGMGLEQSGQNKETGKDRLGWKLALQLSVFFKKQKPHQKYYCCYDDN